LQLEDKMPITPQQARAELAHRELTRRGAPLETISQPQESIGQMLMKNLKGAAQETYQEGIAPLVHGASTLAFGIPRAVARKTGTEEMIYPEQKTLAGKALRFGSEVTGLGRGGAAKGAKLAVKGATKIFPKLAGKGLMKGITKGAIAGGTFGALQQPPEDKSRLQQAGEYSAIGGALPVAGAGAGLVGKGISKVGRGIAKNVGGITDATVATIKRLGVKKVFDPLKEKADYITQNLVPRVYEKVNKIIQTAHDAYNKAVNSAPEGKSINIRPAIEKAKNELRQLGLITKAGNMTELGKSEIARDSVYGKLLDFAQSADAISGVEGLQGKALTQGQMIKAFKALRETRVNKKQFIFFRDKLNALYKNKPSDIDVSGVRDAFYKSAEESGMKGLNAAKALENNVFDIEDKLDIKKIANDLIRAKNPQFTKQIEAEYKKILGDNFKDVWDDLMAHFANKDFGLVTETPGAGGGFYPSRAGLLKGAITKGIKGYYQTVAPKIKGLKESGTEILKRIIK